MLKSRLAGLVWRLVCTGIYICTFHQSLELCTVCTSHGEDGAEEYVQNINKTCLMAARPENKQYNVGTVCPPQCICGWHTLPFLNREEQCALCTLHFFFPQCLLVSSPPDHTVMGELSSALAYWYTCPYG